MDLSEQKADLPQYSQYSLLSLCVPSPSSPLDQGHLRIWGFKDQPLSPPCLRGTDWVNLLAANLPRGRG